MYPCNKNYSDGDATSIYLKPLRPLKFTGSIPQALLFNSSDLKKWTYVSTVWIGNSTVGPRAEYVMIRKVAILSGYLTIIQWKICTLDSTYIVCLHML